MWKASPVFSWAIVFSWLPRPQAKPPQVGEGEVEIARYRRVLIVAIVGVEEIQLVVLCRRMADVLAVDGDPHGPAPGRGHRGDDEAGDVRRDRSPGRLRPDVLLQIEPAIEGHLDGVPGVPRAEPLQHILPKKGAIHAKPDPCRRAAAGSPTASRGLARKGRPAFPSWTLPDRFFTRSTWVVSARCAMIG